MNFINQLNTVAKGILIFLAVVLMRFLASAQIPRPLHIGVTNGVATVSSPTSPGYFFSQLETSTNLTPPMVWTGTLSPVMMPGVRSNFPATGSQSFFRLRQAWPVYEFAIFYNLNMEIDPGGVMPINGLVFSDAGIWAGSASVTFNSAVIAVNQVNTNINDPFLNGKTGSGPPAFLLAGQPVSGASPLRLPYLAFSSQPTNAEAILNLPPPAYALGTANAYSPTGQLYLANAADLIISNAYFGTNRAAPLGTNFSIWFQDPFQTPYLTPIMPDFYRLKIAATTGLYTNYVTSNLSDTNRCYTNVAYAGWSFVTNCAFYDYREGNVAQAVQINVGLFNVWLTNQLRSTFGGSYSATCNSDKGHTIDSIWIYNSVPRDYSTFPAVRVINGVQLANSWGLTVATPMPVYVLGDYNKQTDATHASNGTNTIYTYPEALMGDAITLLSTNWLDSYNSSTFLPSRNPVSTTVNAACFEGIVPSFTNTSNSTYYYSGGVENSLRFLEYWAGTTLTYNGSIVVMFPSIIATNVWGGSYYGVPTRNWGFDFNFLQQTKLLPLTPQVVNFASP